jgi:hypothetical protein
MPPAADPLDRLVTAVLQRTGDPLLREWFTRLAADADERTEGPPRGAKERAPAVWPVPP